MCHVRANHIIVLNDYRDYSLCSSVEYFEVNSSWEIRALLSYQRNRGFFVLFPLSEMTTSAFTFILVTQIRNKGNLHALSLQKLFIGYIFDLNIAIK